ncbi:MAG: SDR family NAD(P)-dependent oxidoreductase, partial [Alphaproteobacteria bacterium]
MSDLFCLQDKTVAITGGGGVLCGGLAQHLAACGMHVAVLDLKADAAEAVVASITQTGGKAKAITANVLERQSVEAALQSCVEAFGPMDILINGAGGNHPDATTGPTKKFFDLPIEAFDKVME